METVTNHQQRVKNLLAKDKTIVIVRDKDDEAWKSGWADYLSTNYNYTNLSDSFRVNLESPKKS